MTEAPQPPTDPKPEDVHHFDYRHVGDSKKARVKARDEQLRGNPEWLYEHDERDGVISSLIFCTLHREEWIDAICEYYPGAVRGKTKKGDTKINLGKKRGSIIVFESGKFLILGSCDLEYFKEGFEDMKKDAMSRVNNTETADDDCDMAEAPQTSTNSKPEVVHEFDFTNVRNGKKPRTKARGEQLRVNPDRLYKQDARHGVIGSLIFYTEHREEWIASIRGYYRGTVREKTQKGDTNIKLGKGRGSIIAYKNGTFFMSGRLGMALFIQKFGAMKRDVMIRVKQNLNRQAPQSSTEPKPITAFKLLSEMEEEVLQFDFKEVQKKPEARLKARDDQLRANTDRLYENIRRRGEISSVIFYTKHTKEWEEPQSLTEALC
uniref:Uncharacterized protein n=1 Tax=Knipowitschia caucasica TaxID=637954 RepID=A0AAV2LBT2_KNICA